MTAREFLQLLYNINYPRFVLGQTFRAIGTINVDGLKLTLADKMRIV